MWFNQVTEKLNPLTFTQDVDGVSFTELQVLGALGVVVVERHHLVQDCAVAKRVLPLKHRMLHCD